MSKRMRVTFSPWWLALGAALLVSLPLVAAPVRAADSLRLVYPPDGHRTSAERIFFIGTAPPTAAVTLNGQRLERSPAGHFAPSFPLGLGANQFTLRWGSETKTITVTRVSNQPQPPVGAQFAPDSLQPARDITRLVGEPLCFRAIAPAGATVNVELAGLTLPLTPQPPLVQLPANAAVLTSDNAPTAVANVTVFAACAEAEQAAALGPPTFRLRYQGQDVAQTGPGAVTILAPLEQPVIEVTAEAGVARTGPSTNHSRLTPLPRGTRAGVTGREGDWLRLDYGGWIMAAETRLLPGAIPPEATIRSVRSRRTAGATEVIFPLDVPVPVAVAQTARSLTLTLYNTTAQTDTIGLTPDPWIERLDWQQSAPGQVSYTFHLRSDQQWGYDLRYEGSSLILTLRHPPALSGDRLQGARILLDPGHGGAELGARGPTGLPEKAVNLTLSQLLRAELERRGATVYMTRETDVELGLRERMVAIARWQPDIALSIHYNALPDSGDALNTAGIGMFWYHTQAHDLAVFLHDYLVETLERPAYGVFWNNLALTRPQITPSILLELGFMINPWEFEWIVNPAEQQRLAIALADGLERWFAQATAAPESP